MKVSQEQIELIRKLRYENEFSINKIADRMQFSVTTVHKYLKGDLSYIPKNKIYWLDINKLYFNNITTVEQAYYLGFIAGDGNIMDNMIRIRIVKEDEEIINSFKKAINYKKPNKYVKLKTGKEQVHLEFRCTQMCKDLAKHSIIPNKSFVLTLPDLPDNLMHSYLLGLFDADGSIFYSKFYKTGRKKAIERYGFSITTNTVLCDQIRTFLLKHDITLSVTAKKNHRNLSIAQISRNQDLVKLAIYLYKNPELGLARKKIKFAEAYNFYQNECSTTTISTPLQGDGIVYSHVKA